MIICPACQTSNDTDALYCKHCGNELSVVPAQAAAAQGSAQKTVNLLLMLVGWRFVLVLLYMGLNRWSIDTLPEELINRVYTLLSGTGTLVEFGILLVTFLKTSHRRTKTILGIYLIFDLLLFASTYLMAYFRY